MAKHIEEVKWILLEPFPIKLWIVMTNNVDRSQKKAMKALGGKRKDSLKGCTAVTVYHDIGGHIYIIYPFDCELRLLVHEVYHAVKQAAKYSGVEDEEFMAYYIGYLTEEVAEFHGRMVKKHMGKGKK